MNSSGYNLKQRPIAVSTESLPSTFTTLSNADSLATTSSLGSILTPRMASLCQEKLGSDSVQGMAVAELTGPTTAASPGYSPGYFPRYQSNVVNVATAVSNAGFVQSPGPAVNVTVSSAGDEFSKSTVNVSAANVANVEYVEAPLPTVNVTVVSDVGFVQSAAQPVCSILPAYTQQQAVCADVSGVSVGRKFVQVARADRPGVHTVLTDRAHNSEVAAYFRDGDTPPPPTAFYYGPPRADSRQSQAAS